MDLYTRTAQLLANILTEQYSTSFSAASKRFDARIRGDIYAIYGLVRVADEIVDTYRGQDAAKLLDDLETETKQAIERGFSINPIVHAFATTAQTYGIDTSLTEPFFTSMRRDLSPQVYTAETLQAYIYGSAEVVGLMCLRVFCEGDNALYEELAPGARRLGAAYQKVNFLRDIADDYRQLGRYYFVESSFATFDDAVKRSITQDIADDFAAAQPYLAALPATARQAVTLSYHYYQSLLQALETAPAETLKQRRLRLGRLQKLAILYRVRLGGKL